jgi:hypothetical protein
MLHTNDQKKSVRIVTVKQVPLTMGYEWLTEQALRHLIFKAEPRKNSKGQAVPTNGLFESGAIIKIGAKILIDLDRFDLWVDQHRQG